MDEDFDVVDDAPDHDEDTGIIIQHSSQYQIDARRRLEARLEDMKLRREIEDSWF